ncbi:MAG: hypothetical protein GQ583_06695 [Methyloprofundus sp.]|nr:hypothetical protein [Methyloprofundus sp.]
MTKTMKLMFLLPIVMAPTLQAETNFLEGARDVVSLHPSCRTENTGMTAVGVVLPNGPEIKVTIEGPDGNDVTNNLSLPYPDALITTSRRSDEVFNGNPIMSASPSFNQAAMFGMDIIKAPVSAFGSRNTEEDAKMIFWKVKAANVYDANSNTLMELPYIPVNGFIILEMGFALPKFTPASCLMSMNVRGAQISRCDEVDPETKMILADSKPDIRKKRMRLIVERDLENNPLPAHCGEGISVTIEPTDVEVEELTAKMNMMTP